MVSNDFDAEQFERRLHTLKDSQESIQSLSAWCLERRQHHKKIVAAWLQVLKKVKIEHRLTLFYLANDVIQYSKRKNYEFVESWGTTLQRATTMVRDEKVKHRILRIFKIWDQRSIYDEEFLIDLSGLISAAPKKKVESHNIQQPEEFQAALLISTMRSCSTLEQATDARLKDLKNTNVDIENAEGLCSSLKDRRGVEDVEKEVDHTARNIENYVRALEAELKERKQVLELLEQADQFYETQRSEVKIVVNAYRNFGSRVKNLKKKLDELIPMLASPLPSPDINAPSPSPDSDIELPDESTNHQSLVKVVPPSIYGSFGQDYNPATAPINNTISDFTNNFSSFIGGNLDFDPRNIFSENSIISTSSQQYDDVKNKLSEVIEVCPSAIEKENNDRAQSYLKPVLPILNTVTESCLIPGLGDVTDNVTDSISIKEPKASISSVSTIPLIGRSSITSMSNLNHNKIGHSTPLTIRKTNGEPQASSYLSENSHNNVSQHTMFEPAISTPLPPPPMPPIEFLDDNNCYNKLPPKFPTWTFANETLKEPVKWTEDDVFPIANDTSPVWPINNKVKNQWNETSSEQWDMPCEISAWSENVNVENISETPESPPLFEKTGFHPPVEYDDLQTQEPILSSVGDVDHRILPMPMSMEKELSEELLKSGDIDHRNLISLTGSPANNSNDAPSVSQPNNTLWTNIDQDYRKTNVSVGDNVESVDMEMSDEENENKKNNRMLMDLRSHDRDMRISSNLPISILPAGSLHHNTDMDMRQTSNFIASTNALNGPSQAKSNLKPELHEVDTRPCLSSHTISLVNEGHSNFRLNYSNFRQNKSLDARHNQLFRQNSRSSMNLDYRPGQSQQEPRHNQTKQDFRSNINQVFRRSLNSQDIKSNQNLSSTSVQEFNQDFKDDEFVVGASGRGLFQWSGTNRGSGVGMLHGNGGSRPSWVDRGGQIHRSMSLGGSFSSPMPPMRGMKTYRSPFRGMAIYRGRSRGGGSSW